VLLKEGPRVNFVQPSADVAMMSVLRPLKAARIAGVILTGMGRDGAEGIRHIKSIGGITFAQEKDSCAIYGMPRAAMETGAVDFESTPQGITKKLIEIFGKMEP
jgi:two-component system chemotaxis response regulator CheB